MAWQAYKVVLRLLTPLHVGAGQIGNLQRARPYVTGKVLWGALTARLTRDVSALGGDYVAVGRRVAGELAFSYFYPIAAGETDVTVWPWGETADEFAWRYLSSYAATALDYGQNTAADGSLHETEFIAPVTRDGEPVHLIGYVIERAGSALPWQKALARLQLGGERTYGWGRVGPVKLTPADGCLFGQWALRLDEAAPICSAADGARLLAHTWATGPQAVAGVTGSVEPLIGRETNQAQQHGELLAAAAICWPPGSQAAGGLTVCIQEYGVWAGVAPLAGQRV